MNLLVVDWDYFFPVVEIFNGEDDSLWQLYDWGHSEHDLIFFNVVWVSRAAAFKRNDIPIPMTSGLERDFWKRFKLSPRAQLFYADSNAQAYNERVHRHVGLGDQVWLFDAHHDTGYNGTLDELMERGHVTCEDWMVPYALSGAELHVRYPKWRPYAMTFEPEPLVEVDRQVDDEQPVDVVFDRVFVCRSGAWTPPWLDDEFFDFVKRAPVKKMIALSEGFGPRDWDWERVDQSIESLDAFNELLERHPELEPSRVVS